MVRLSKYLYVFIDPEDKRGVEVVAANSEAEALKNLRGDDYDIPMSEFKMKYSINEKLKTKQVFNIPKQKVRRKLERL